ncbi:MAG: O-methyltransferase [Paludibacteraceae bacterium]|nr:O-methyltransferase [Paludibacteraceae bacterium]
MNNIYDYIAEHSTAESELLKEITRETNLHVLNPHMLSGHVQGRVLSMMSKMIQPKYILELGTYTGYSALCMAEGLRPDGKLITIEHNDELEERIHRNFSQSDFNDKIELVIGDACERVTELINKGMSNQLDLIFIDADKREYSKYIDLVYPLVRQGGWILADNTLWDGHIIDPDYDKDPQTRGLRAFNDKIRDDERFEKVILPLRDGLTIIRKI